MRLVGRRSECGMLDRLVEAVRAGDSRALVLCGEAGVGKTALLQHLIQKAADCQVMQTAGVESEMELAFAGLHQLCAPLLGSLGDLPERQTAVGIGRPYAYALSYGGTQSLTHYLSICGFKDIATLKAVGCEPTLTAVR